MTDHRWNQIRGLTSEHDFAWELFHEASKLGRYDDFPSQADILARMQDMHDSLPLSDYPAVDLPTGLVPLRLSLSEAILTRRSAHGMVPGSLSLAETATLLHHGYGVTFDNTGTSYPRPFRAAPSGGAMYPLEIFFFSKCVEGLKAGLYHYNPAANQLRLVREGDLTAELAEVLIPFQRGVVFEASLVMFVSALFERSVFKYGTRGYRFVLLEAGHVAQNINLVAGGLGLSVLNLGGFYDRKADGMLGMDGLTQSTLYMLALGKPHTSPAGDHADHDHADHGHTDHGHADHVHADHQRPSPR